MKPFKTLLLCLRPLLIYLYVLIGATICTQKSSMRKPSLSENNSETNGVYLHPKSVSEWYLEHKGLNWINLCNYTSTIYIHYSIIAYKAILSIYPSIFSLMFSSRYEWIWSWYDREGLLGFDKVGDKVGVCESLEAFAALCVTIERYYN